MNGRDGTLQDLQVLVDHLPQEQDRKRISRGQERSWGTETRKGATEQVRDNIRCGLKSCGSTRKRRDAGRQRKGKCLKRTFAKESPCEVLTVLKMKKTFEHNTEKIDIKSRAVVISN